MCCSPWVHKNLVTEEQQKHLYQNKGLCLGPRDTWDSWLELRASESFEGEDFTSLFALILKLNLGCPLIRM